MRAPAFARSVLALALLVGGAACSQRHDDASITQAVRERIQSDRSLDSPDVSVITNGGDVVLTGTVRRPSDRRRVEDLARDVDGVRDVANRLQVAETPATPSAPPRPAVSAPPPAPSPSPQEAAPQEANPPGAGPEEANPEDTSPSQEPTR